jgi:hypothetical protein
MPAVFSRVHNWITEILTSSAINAEFNNILNNLDPTGVGSYSTTVAQMKLQTSPGGLGTESLATSLGGELERLRYVIAQLIGPNVQYWYQAPPTTLSALATVSGGGLPTYRIVSGATTGTSSQVVALFPTGGTGTAAGVVLSAATIPFVYYINGTSYQVSSNVTISGLGLSSGTGTTSQCFLFAADSGTTVSAQQFTRGWGMYGTQIPIGNVGSNILALAGNGKIAGFSTTGASTEYFLASVNSTSSGGIYTLGDAWRGCMWNNAAAWAPATGLVCGATPGTSTITLLNTAWIFINTSGQLLVTYNNPTVAAIAPTGASGGDYWFNLSNTAWMTFNSVTWTTAAATLIGVSMQSTNACVATRTFDSYISSDSLNNISLNKATNTVIQANDVFSQVAIFGNTNKFQTTRPSWNSSTNLDAGVTLSPSTTYFMYMEQTGQPVISDQYPLKRGDLKGLYHPRETWRCLGSADTDSNTNFTTYVKSFTGVPVSNMLMVNSNLYGQNLYAGYAPLGLNQVEAQFNDIYPTNYASVIVAGNTNLPSTASNTLFDFATMSLTPGLWAVSACADVYVVSGTASSSQWTLGVSTAQGTSFNDSVASLNAVSNFMNVVFAASYEQSLYINRYLMRINNTPTNVYLKGWWGALAPVATGQIATRGYHIKAERIDVADGTPR